jgi:nucleotide-binding universal stress UspA family protein
VDLVVATGAIMNVTRILCPTDFSDASDHAVDLAVAIAGAYHARLAAIHVAREAVVPLEFATPSGGVFDAAELDALRARTAARFAAAPAAGIELDVFLDTGAPADRILDRAAALPADLIVMGTHGSRGFERLMLGSVTERVLRRACCPVLTVPPRAHATSRLPFRRLLCAVDFSEPSLAALQFAASLAVESDAALTLLHVLEWPWNEPPPPDFAELPAPQGPALAEYRRYRESMASAELEALRPAAARGATPPTTRLRHGKPYVQILEAAAEEGSDLIIVGVHGRNPVDMSLFGSTANQIVRRATCPVLTLRR